MRDFPILPILLILYVIVVSGRKRKKNGQRSARAASRAEARRERMQQRAAQAASWRETRTEHPQHEQASRGFSAASDRTPHVPIPEGEDPCHPAPKREIVRAEKSQDDGVQADEPQMSLLAQDLLRGVIMSEILTRPSERRARNRQGYHG
ncbi:MAG: hypothetical protein ACI4MM_05315 [Candidatus Ventricola sp.]